MVAAFGKIFPSEPPMLMSKTDKDGPCTRVRRGVWAEDAWGLGTLEYQATTPINTLTYSV